MQLHLVFRSPASDRQQHLALPAAGELVVGRSAGCDLPIVDPTISRRHATVTIGDDGLRLADLGSTNGTFVNGRRLDPDGVAEIGDCITFGQVDLDLIEATTEAPPGPALDPSATVLREVRRPMPFSGRLDSPAIAGLAVSHATGQMVVDLEGEAQERSAMRLALLLEVSQELSRQPEVDRLLEKVADLTFQVMDVDRVAIDICDRQTSDLSSKVSLARGGETVTHRFVPSSIARRVTEEKIALLTEDAAGDSRFSGQSIILNRVRSAMCAPLLGSQGRVLGLLYVDNTTAPHSLDEEDLDFLVAFSGIAAVALENSELVERSRREAVVLANFQRYFAPDLALRILHQEGAVEPGGDRLEAVILFADIRGFTRLAAGLTPEEIATLLNEFFTEMASVIFEHDGVLDKFIGDAVMALWGVPVADPEAPQKALAAADAMQEAVSDLNRRWAEEGRPQVGVGIGVNGGEVFAGNLGSAERLEYTAIGDPVNVAARLCDVAGAGEVLVAQHLMEALDTELARGSLREVEIRGRDLPLWAVSFLPE